MRAVKLALAASFLLAAMIVPATSAAPTPEGVDPRVGQRCEGGTKIEITSGFVNGTTFNLNGGGTVTLSIFTSPAGQTLAFATDEDHVVTSVIIKGGPISIQALMYSYPGGSQADSGLHAPFNPNSGKWYGVSFACFQTDKKEADPK